MEVDIGAAFKKSYRIMRDSREMLFFMALVFFITSSLYILSGLTMKPLGPGTMQDLTQSELWKLILLLMVVYLMVLAVGAIINAGVIKTTYDRLKGESSLNKSLKNAFEVFFSLYGANIAVFIILFLATMGLLLFSFVCCIGFIIVPVIMVYLFIRLAFFPYPIVLKKISAMEGVSYSWEITEGRVLDLFLYFLIVAVIIFPLSLYIYIPLEFFYVSIPLLILYSFFIVWTLSATTIVYIQISEDRKKKDYRAPVDYRVPHIKTILLAGFSMEEAEIMRKSGLPVHSISSSGRYAKVRDILEAPWDFEGDSRWTDGKYAIFHGFSPSDMVHLMNAINNASGGDVKFASTTEISMEWTFYYLIKELSSGKKQ